MDRKFDGDVMRHPEFPEWHVTRSMEALPGGNRIFRMYCGQEIPVAIGGLGILKGWDAEAQGHDDRLPCPQCSWLVLRRLRTFIGYAKTA